MFRLPNKIAVLLHFYSIWYTVSISLNPLLQCHSFHLLTLLGVTTPSSDPCSDYKILDDHWRDVLNFHGQYYGYDDTLVEWNGWYRLYLNGETAQMSEWCVSFSGCGGDTGLYLNGSHPRLEDGVVTREVLGTSWRWNSQCGYYTSSSIQVKACGGNYYVYKLVKPEVSIPRPTYCAGACVFCIYYMILLCMKDWCFGIAQFWNHIPIIICSDSIKILL